MRDAKVAVSDAHYEGREGERICIRKHPSHRVDDGKTNFCSMGINKRQFENRLASSRVCHKEGGHQLHSGSKKRHRVRQKSSRGVLGNGQLKPMLTNRWVVERSAIGQQDRQSQASRPNATNNQRHSGSSGRLGVIAVPPGDETVRSNRAAMLARLARSSGLAWKHGS
jgi:hypothetical protein